MCRVLPLIVVLFVALTGCQNSPSTAPNGGQNTPSTTPKTYTEDAFKKEFLGARADAVRARLGAPDDIGPGENSQGWTFRNRTTNSAGKTNELTHLLIQDDRVTMITFFEGNKPTK